jgi:drug/metabolite transporter (DMT)-like permease
VTVPLLEFASGKQLKTRQWMGAFLAVLGVAMLELVPSTVFAGAGVGAGDVIESSGMMVGEQAPFQVGDICSLLQPLAFGMGFLRMERAMQLHPDHASRSTAAQLLAVFFVSTVYGRWSIDTPTLQSFPWHDWLSSPTIILSLFWTGCVTAISIYMETVGLKTLSAAETTLIFATEPLWGTAFAACVMGEQLGVNEGIGAAFILTGCVYSNLGLSGLASLWKQTASHARTATLVGQASSNDLRDRQWLWLSSMWRQPKP